MAAMGVVLGVVLASPAAWHHAEGQMLMHFRGWCGTRQPCSSAPRRGPDVNGHTC